MESCCDGDVQEGVCLLTTFVILFFLCLCILFENLNIIPCRWFNAAADIVFNVQTVYSVHHRQLCVVVSIKIETVKQSPFLFLLLFSEFCDLKADETLHKMH